MIADGKDKSTIAAEMNKESQLNLQVEEGVFSKEEKDILKKVDFKLGLSNNIEDNGQVKFVDVKNIIEPMPKKLEEARGLITSEYQTHLEQEWISELRKKHKFTVNRDALYQIK
jgi:peptidyl-prolyl cis-trans isomerase SurA